LYSNGDWFQSYWYGEFYAGYAWDGYCNLLSLVVMYALIWELFCDGDGFIGW
jgi:hypothetical protein